MSDDMEVMDFNFEEFVEKLFNNPPFEPNDMYIEFDDINNEEKKQMIYHMLQRGANILFNKVASEMDPNEILLIKKYFYSIGIDVNHKYLGNDINGNPIIEIDVYKYEY